MCSKKPVGVRSFALYIVGLTKVNFADLTADDNGIWQVSMPRRSYEVKQVGDTIIGIEEIKDPGGANVFTMLCQYGTHADTPEFRRIITTVYSDEKVCIGSVLLQRWKEGSCDFVKPWKYKK